MSDLWDRCQMQFAHTVHWCNKKFMLKLKLRKFGVRFLTQEFNCCIRASRYAGACPAGTKSLQDTLLVCLSLAAVWRHYDVVKQDWRSQWEITRISCFVTTIKLPHALQINAVAFFKVAQQQTIGKVGNSIICLWTDNFCLQSERIIKISQYLRKLCWNEEGSSFLMTHSVVDRASEIEGGGWYEKLRWSEILAENRDFFHTSAFDFPDVWYGKTRMVWLYAIVKNCLKICLAVSTATGVWQTDGRTDRHHAIG